MLEKLIPREFGFFDLFEKHINKTLDGVNTFQTILEDVSEISGKTHRIEEIEHECDSLVHLTKELLHKTFITPIERDDIQNLISNMDDIIDFIHAAAQRILLFEIKEVLKEFIDMIKVLTHSIEEVKKAVFNLRNVKKTSPEILKSIVEIHRLENEGDGYMRAGFVRLFKEDHDALFVIKWKEILEKVELAIDACEDIADILNKIILENQ